MPLDSSSDYVIVRTFYEKDDTKENQLNSLIKYENSYRTSLGTSYALKSGDYFNVVASITGIVSEVSTSPLFGNYVVITSDDNIKMYYYGLSEIEVTKGNTINQGETIGKSGTTVIDSETGIHVYFQITKDGKYLNPEKVIGLKVTELK
jgi:stage II sporulation protein Q